MSPVRPPRPLLAAAFGASLLLLTMVAGLLLRGRGSPVEPNVAAEQEDSVERVPPERPEERVPRTPPANRPSTMTARIVRAAAAPAEPTRASPVSPPERVLTRGRQAEQRSTKERAPSGAPQAPPGRAERASETEQRPASPDRAGPESQPESVDAPRLAVEAARVGEAPLRVRVPGALADLERHLSRAGGCFAVSTVSDGTAHVHASYTLHRGQLVERDFSICGTVPRLLRDPTQQRVAEEAVRLTRRRLAGSSVALGPLVVQLVLSSELDRVARLELARRAGSGSREPVVCDALGDGTFRCR